MIKKEPRKVARRKRHLRVRKKIFGTQERPRLNVFKSLKHIYAQIINDETGTTLVAASTRDPAIRDVVTGCNVESARKVGELIAKKAVEKGIKKVAFDRGGYVYHGRVKALAEAAREAGLEF
ncbi:MAG: large subunit ribosomal protein [Tepidanaerobacteraceae bacterium]|nr:large subunit ribosomal protein [Tepidanaerobacteraceae bacterium]